MKRATILLVLSLAAALSGVHAGTGIRLENDLDSLVFYTAVSKANGLDPALIGKQDIQGLVETGPEGFAYLPPRGVVQSWQLPPSGGFLLLLVSNGSRFLPRWIPLPLPKDIPQGSEAYLSFAASRSISATGGDELSISSLDLALPTGGIRIDGRFVDWLTVPEVLTSRNGAVLGVTRSDAKGVAAIQPKDALSRAKGGTDLELVKVESDSNFWYLMISSRSAMVRGLSYLIRAALPGSKNPDLVIEIPVAELGGPVLLWAPTTNDPRLVGDYAQIGLFLEARIRKSELSAAQSKVFEHQQSRFSVASSWSDGSYAEEWSYGSFEGKTLVKTGKK